MTPEYILRAAIRDLEHRTALPFCGSDTLQARVHNAQSELDSLQWANGYVEPGYSNPEHLILFANWNHFPSRVTDLLERMGYSVEWSDEWSQCGDCGLAVRTSPDSYKWRRSYAILNDCEIVCSDCIHQAPKGYLDELTNNHERADTLDIDLAAHGFQKFNGTYENGLHPGQNDNPEEIVKLLPDGVDYIFQIPSVGQFDITFTLWYRV
jgi:hypothetical protein